ncbi:uncharacterized protein LOC109539770 [Dendroctonus ponderosae]|uniref:Uncharacterized protein n=1 Tax=Dendroctonus ponderosae TaxID=77166 RepID=A0AAR5PQL2_DENPD|nr:uncharacterized protein LOC109539770 [Dendroctonus ponderosae]
MAGVFFRIGSLNPQALVVPFLLLLLATLSVVDASPIINPGWVCSKNTTRQVRSAAERELQSMIHTINHQMLPEIRATYPHQSNVKTKTIKCPRINKLISSISAQQNIVRAHQKFHKSLMEMSFVLDHLQKLSINAEFTDLKQFQQFREKIYSTTKARLGLVICEFDEIITFDYNATVLPFNPSTKRISCIPKDPDLTQIGALDMQYFNKLRRLFMAGKAILKKLKRKSTLLTKRRRHSKTRRHND